MRLWDRVVFNVIGFAVAASGFAYLWMKYFLVSDDPFATINHPWESAMLSAHVLTSPVFILAFGILLNAHIIKQLRSWRRENRVSGLTSLGMFATMVASGYLLQVVTSEALLTALVIIHVGSGAIFAAVYAGHLIITLRLPAQPQADAVTNHRMA
jgi:hypothetical protein